MYLENETCNDYLNNFNKCKNWIDNPNKTNLSEECYEQIWLYVGCNPKKSYKNSWNDKKNYKQTFIDYFQWRANNCGVNGVQPKGTCFDGIDGKCFNDILEFECKTWNKNKNLNDNDFNKVFFKGVKCNELKKNVKI